MKVEQYNALMARMSRRRMLQGATALGAMAALPMTARRAAAEAHGNVRAEILKIPGVGMGSPTDATGRRSARCALVPPRPARPRVSSRGSS